MVWFIFPLQTNQHNSTCKMKWTVRFAYEKSLPNHFINLWGHSGEQVVLLPPLLAAALCRMRTKSLSCHVFVCLFIVQNGPNVRTYGKKGPIKSARGPAPVQPSAEAASTTKLGALMAWETVLNISWDHMWAASRMNALKTTRNENWTGGEAVCLTP